MYFEIGGKMPLGKIKWFDSKKGYGFIKEDKIVVFPLPKKPVKTVIEIFFGNEDIIN